MPRLNVRATLLCLSLLLSAFLPSSQFGNPANLSAILLAIVCVIYADQSTILALLWQAAILAVAIAISSLSAIFQPHIDSLSIAQFGVYFRILVSIHAFSLCGRDATAVERCIFVVTAMCSAFAICQFSSPLAASLTGQYYITEERMLVLTASLSDDRMVRTIGTFESPSMVAVVAFASFIFLHAAYRGNRISFPLAMAGFVLHLSAALSSLSKLIVPGLIMSLIYIAWSRSLKMLVAFCLVSAFFMTAVLAASDVIGPLLAYTLTSAGSAESTFAGRYVDEQTLEVVAALPIGNGIFIPREVIINDSAFLTLGYQFGLLALPAFALIAAMFYRRKTEPSLKIIFTLLIIAAIGTNSLFGYRVEVLLSAIIGISLIPKREGLKWNH